MLVCFRTSQIVFRFPIEFSKQHSHALHVAACTLIRKGVSTVLEIEPFACVGHTFRGRREFRDTSDFIHIEGKVGRDIRR